MCNPNPIALVAVTAISGFAQYQQGQAAAKATEVTAANNAKIGEYNAQLDEKSATDATRRGAEDSYQERVKAKQANATFRASGGSSGLIVDTGTNLNIQGQNAGTGEFNALTVQNNAEREAYGYKQSATSKRFGVQVDTANAGYQAKVQRLNGLLSGASTFATGTANYGSSAGWFKGK